MAAKEHFQIGSVNTSELTEDDIRAFYELCADGFQSYVDNGNNLISFFRNLIQKIGLEEADNAVFWLFGSDSCTSIIDDYDDEDGWFKWDHNDEKFNAWIIDDLCLYMNNNYSGEKYVDEFIDGMCWDYVENHCAECVDGMLRMLVGTDFEGTLLKAMGR